MRTADIFYASTIGNAMSMATINGGNLRDVLKSGRDTATDTDTLKNTLTSGLSAGITAGITEYLDKTNSLTKGIISNGNLDINPEASLKQQFTSKLVDSAASNITSTAVQSTINGDSFSEALKHQAINTIVMARANYAANQIGNLSHGKLDIDNNGNIIYTEPQINKVTQLLLHAGLGAITNALTGNDALSGAIAGVSGEVFAELLKNTMYGDIDVNRLTNAQKDSIANLSGLASGVSSLFVGQAKGLDVNDVRNNVYSGYRVGQNAAKNNYLMPKEKREYKKELDGCGDNKSCKNEVREKYKKISDPRDEKINKLLLYGDPKDLEKFHYDLRMELTEEGNQYYSSLSEEEREKEFIKLDDSASIYHTFQQDENGRIINIITGSEQGYTKYVHPVYGYEVVLDNNKNIITNPLNIGTYNFYNPNLDGVELDPLLNGNTKHFLYNVVPYYKYGNSPDDPGIGSDRIIRNLNILFIK